MDASVWIFSNFHILYTIFRVIVNKITKIRLANPVGLCYNNGRRFGYASLNRKQVQFLREPVTVNADVNLHLPRLPDCRVRKRHRETEKA